MNHIPIFPEIIGATELNTLPDSYIEECKDFIINKLELEPNYDSKNDYITKTQDILEIPIFNKLKQNIIKEAQEYIKELNIPPVDLQISTSWSYVAYKGNSQNKYHTHANSQFSGIFYLTEGGNLSFANTSYEKFTFSTGNFTENENKKNLFSITPYKKLLIFFPSYIPHQILPNNTIPRISIPFNLVPKGKIGGSGFYLSL